MKRFLLILVPVAAGAAGLILGAGLADPGPSHAAFGPDHDVVILHCGPGGSLVGWTRSDDAIEPPTDSGAVALKALLDDGFEISAFEFDAGALVYTVVRRR